MKLKKRKKRKNCKSWFWPLVGFVFVGFVVLLLCVVFYFPMAQNQEVRYVHLKKNCQMSDFIQETEYTVSVKYPFIFEQIAKIALRKGIPTGRYAIDNKTTIFKFIRSVRAKRQYPVKLIINNIRTKNQLLNLISSKLMMSKEELSQLINNQRYCNAMGMDSTNIIELIFPDNYEFYWDVSPGVLMDSFKNYYDKFWNTERMALLDNLKLTKNEVTIIASIVEEESNKPKEYGKIARLYINRYKIGMPLQADPTVKFANNDFTLKRILKAHLQVDSPYNTYKYAGLPPGPIRLAKKSTIDSILQSEPNSYIYMCAKEDFSGYHNFATTYKEHKLNAIRYQKELNKRGIK